MRIGLLGGTFDPVHNGHLALAGAACKQFKLDRVLFIPAFQHPVKEKRVLIASPESRMEMLKLATEGVGKFAVSDCEIRRCGVSYTVETLRAFRKTYPKPNDLFFITGGDWGKNLDQWKDIDEIFSLVYFVVARRPGFDLANLPRAVKPLDFVPLDISSTEIRSRVRNGVSIASLVPEGVDIYIQKHQLYRA